MTMLTRLSATALLLAAPTLYAAEDWQIIPTASANVIFALDRDSIQRQDRMVRFWEKLTYATPEARDEASGKWIKEKRVRRVMNCAEQTQGFTEGITYGEKETFITSVSFADQQIKMSAIPPDTVAAKEFSLVCDPAIEQRQK